MNSIYSMQVQSKPHQLTLQNIHIVRLWWVLALEQARCDADTTFTARMKIGQNPVDGDSSG
jgi:hypothetical protein